MVTYRSVRNTLNILVVTCFLAGCRSPKEYRVSADETVGRILSKAQEDVLGHTEEIRVESARDALRRRLITEQNLPIVNVASRGIYDLPADDYWNKKDHLLGKEEGAESAGELPNKITLLDAMGIAAANSPAFQNAKDTLFRAALDLDLEADEFRASFTGALTQLLDGDGGDEDRIYSSVTGADGGVTRTFRNGLEFTTSIALDLVKLLSQDKASTRGIYADASLSIPLLRGSGEKVQTENLKQAERNVLYAVYDFERYKRTFAVDVATSYMGVLRQAQQVENQEENYRGLITATRRARRLADSGLLPEFQFDQAIQNELKAREGWISAKQSYASRLDSFKVLLGLPPDSLIELSDQDLVALSDRAKDLMTGTLAADYSGEIPPADAEVVLVPPSSDGAGTYELRPDRAVRLALDARLDLKKAACKVDDAKRDVYMKVDRLRGEITLLGTSSIGGTRGAGSTADPATLKVREMDYSALLTFDLPFERTAERNAYRESLIALEDSVREYQKLEDSIKLRVLDDLRDLLEQREGVRIQKQAVSLAEKRVRSTDLFLQAGRAAIRDLLDARASLLSAQNGLADALVSYRLAELALQRDIGLLQVSAKGLWREYKPEE